MQKQEGLKQKRITTKSQGDDIEGEVNEIRKKLNQQEKECSAVTKQINAIENKLEQKKADRHSLLKACKVGKRTG